MLTHVATRREQPTASGRTGGGELGPSSLDMSGNDRARKPVCVVRATVSLPGSSAVGAFDWNGGVFAGGSSEGAVRIVDAQLAMHGGASEEHVPIVLKTLLDHTEAVTSVVFHPKSRVVLSGSKDKTIRFFSYTGMATRSFAHIADSHPIRSIALHPSGDFILCGAAHALPRIYQTEHPGAPALVALDPGHGGPITHVHWAAQGNVYLSSSRDGSVKLWDATACRVVRTFAGIHGGEAVWNSQLSRSGTYVLTSGGDGTARVFDVRTGGLLRVYKGLGRERGRTAACFAGGDEQYVVGGGDGNHVLFWDTLQGGQAINRTSLSVQDAAVQCVTHPSSNSPAFAACSAEGKVSFFSEHGG